MTKIYNATEDMTQFAQQTGVDIQFINSKIGDVQQLTTTAKVVVPAINELKRSIDNVNANLGGTSLDEKLTNIKAETKQEVKSELLDGSPEALDTLKELGEALNNDPNFATALSKKLNNKVDFATVQTLTQEQKKQARENIGIVAPQTTLLQSYLTARGDLGND